MAKKSNKLANVARMNMIQGEAKKIWQTGKCKMYSQAVKKACELLKKAGKL
jgi:hypothetical protein